jgi:hypothetical protein
MSYNEHGDVIHETSQDDDREFSVDDEGQLITGPASERVSRSEARFAYEYDEHGNWLSKTIEVRGGSDRDFTLSSVECRTITYLP